MLWGSGSLISLSDLQYERGGLEGIGWSVVGVRLEERRQFSICYCTNAGLVMLEFISLQLLLLFVALLGMSSWYKLETAVVDG